MATILNANHPSLLDLIKSENFDGATEKTLGELLEKDALMQTIPWYATSDGMRHKDVKALKLGSGDFVSANSGTGTTSSDIQTLESNVVFYSVLSQVDDVVLKAGTAKQARSLRLEQNELNLKGFQQGFVNKLFYGTTVADPNGLNGLAQRRNVKSSKYVFDGGKESGDVTSVYLMQFGKDAVNMRHQEGKSGFQTEDRGMHSYKLTSGNIIDYWEMKYSMWALLDVFDERSLIRYANIDPTGTTNGITAKAFIQMKNLLPNVGQGAAAFVNRSLITQAEVLLSEKSNVYYTRSEIEGFGAVIKFMGVPFLLQDCISDSETVVS